MPSYLPDLPRDRPARPHPADFADLCRDGGMLAPKSIQDEVAAAPSVPTPNTNNAAAIMNGTNAPALLGTQIDPGGRYAQGEILDHDEPAFVLDQTAVRSEAGRNLHLSPRFLSGPGRHRAPDDTLVQPQCPDQPGRGVGPKFACVKAPSQRQSDRPRPARRAGLSGNRPGVEPVSQPVGRAHSFG